MYLLKNAWRNVVRSKARNILIGIIVFVISVSTCISLSIREAAENAKESGIENIEITGQITLDRQSIMKDMDENGMDRSQMKDKLQETQELSVSELKKYAKSDAVKNFYYTLTTSLNGKNVEEISSSSQGDEQTKEGMPMEMPQNENQSNQGAFSLIGYSSEEAMAEFIDGTSKLVEGEVFQEHTKEFVCMISDELATYNSIKVGDFISFENPGDTTQTTKLKVIGIYSNSKSSTGQDGTIMQFQSMSDPANQILMSEQTLQSIVDEMDSLVTQVNGTYVFQDQEKYEQFEKDVKEMGLDTQYTVVSQDINNYEQSLIPLQNLSRFATYFFVVILIIGAIILVVLNVFHIRERKYEIGVLTAIGMKKKKVCAQFVMEIFIVVMCAMLMGIFGGSILSVPVSNQLLQSQVQNQEEQMTQRELNFGRDAGKMKKSDKPEQDRETSGNMVSYVSEISASVNFSVILQLLGIGILLTFLSGFFAVVSVLCYEPLQILSHRS